MNNTEEGPRGQKCLYSIQKNLMKPANPVFDRDNKAKVSQFMSNFAEKNIFNSYAVTSKYHTRVKVSLMQW